MSSSAWRSKRRSKLEIHVETSAYRWYLKPPGWTRSHSKRHLFSLAKVEFQFCILIHP